MGSKEEKKLGVLTRQAIILVKGYKSHISPLFPACCIYYPTCSEYAIQAFTKYGVLRGGWFTLKRIIRCNPFHKGGYDPVP